MQPNLIRHQFNRLGKDPLEQWKFTSILSLGPLRRIHFHFAKYRSLLIQCVWQINALPMSRSRMLRHKCTVKCILTFLTDYYIRHRYTYIQYTVKTQHRKFESNIPRTGIAWPQSQFLHSCFCKRVIYFHDRSAYSAAWKYVDRSWECGNLGLRPRNSFSGNR